MLAAKCNRAVAGKMWAVARGQDSAQGSKFPELHFSVDQVVGLVVGSICSPMSFRELSSSCQGERSWSVHSDVSLHSSEECVLVAALGLSVENETQSSSEEKRCMKQR